MGSRRSLAFGAFVGLSYGLIGCGGGGAGTGGGTAPVGTTQKTANATARFHVDVKTGQVTITPLNSAIQPTSRNAPAAFRGNMVGFSSSLLVDEPGDTGRKVLNVSLQNNSGEAIGTMNGNPTGLRILFSGITNVNSVLSIEPQTTVSLTAGSGAGNANGPVLSARFNHDSGVAFNPKDGSFWVADSNNNQIKRIYDGLVTTIAGSGTASSVDGAGKVATFNDPTGIAYNPVDQSFVVADFLGNKIRRVTMSGEVSTLAGTGATGETMGTGNTATITEPYGVVLAPNGTIYVTAVDNMVRKITFSGGSPTLASNYTVSLFAGNSGGASGFADGFGSTASFNAPRGITMDPSGALYVAEYGNNAIRMIEPSSDVVTIAGNGTSADVNGAGFSAEFSNPIGITYSNGILFVGDTHDNKIRVMGLSPGAVPTQASNWMVADAAGTGTAGSTNGSGSSATLNAPANLATDASGNVYVADYGNSEIREVEPVSGTFTIGMLTGSGTPVSAPVTLANATGIIPNSGYGADLPYIEYMGSLNLGQFTGAQQWAFVVPNGVNAFDFTVTVEADTTTLAQPGAAMGAGSPNVDVRTYAGEVNAPIGYVDGGLTEARFGGFVSQIAVDSLGDVFVADQNTAVLRIITPAGQVATIAGEAGNLGYVDGSGLTAQFEEPAGIAVTSDGANIYVTDEATEVIRCITTTKPGSSDPADYTVGTVAGTHGSSGWTDGNGATAVLTNPYSITMTSSGDLYFTEVAGGNRVRRLRFLGGGTSGRLSASSYLVQTVAGNTSGASGFVNGTGESAEFSLPSGIAADLTGNLYVADFGNEVIRKVTVDGVVTTFSGNGTEGYADGASASAEFSQPRALCVDSGGYVYVSDSANSMIRRISPAGITETVCGSLTRGDVDGPGNTAKLSDPNGICISSAGTIYFSDGEFVSQSRERKAPTASGSSISNSIRMVQEVETNNNAQG